MGSKESRNLKTDFQILDIVKTEKAQPTPNPKVLAELGLGNFCFLPAITDKFFLLQVL